MGPANDRCIQPVATLSETLPLYFRRQNVKTRLARIKAELKAFL